MKKEGIIMMLCLFLSAGCSAAEINAEETTAAEKQEEVQETQPEKTSESAESLSAEDIFTDRDMEQEADLSEAVAYDSKDGETVTITKAGTYVFKGTAQNYQIVVEAGSEDKVQIVLDGLQVTNEDKPAVYVKSADKVFITTTEGTENMLKTTGEFTDDGDEGTDGVIYSKDDLVLNGKGTLTVESSDNAVVSKDDLKVTGGTLNITCANNALQAHDSVAVADGNITIVSQDDGIKARYDEDDSVGYVYISGGTININAQDDAVHAETILQIDGGKIIVDAHEGLEATVVRINDGEISVKASDDGVNAAAKSSAYTPLIEINGGSLTIDMGQGDTDALDSNGKLVVNGGTITITAQFAFDFVTGSEFNGGTITVNGQEVTQITESMMTGGRGGMMEGRQKEDGQTERPDGETGPTEDHDGRKHGDFPEKDDFPQEGEQKQGM
ncbi:MAG: carbohydrate-binding domain-containing protein [Solobacterium sp.]|nr:carbohydrate-binding domain-containing protein [Solobacterium sp.]